MASCQIAAADRMTGKNILFQGDEINILTILTIFFNKQGIESDISYTCISFYTFRTISVVEQDIVPTKSHSKGGESFDQT